MRRLLLRLATGDLARVVAEMITLFDRTVPEELAESVRGYLSRLNVASTYWPGDEELRGHLSIAGVYRAYRRGRLRTVLEAVENSYRDGTNQPQVPRRGYPIEHILPQAWEQNWPVAGEAEAFQRAEHVHRLGNLTLLTTALISKVSNAPWQRKRKELNKHDTLILNRRVLARSDQSEWEECHIDARTTEIIEAVVNIWPVPAGHEGGVIDPHAKAQLGRIQVKDLIAAALIEPGTVLSARPGVWESHTAIIRPDGAIEVAGRTFESLSSAGKFVKGAVTNGWSFWRVPDGRRMSEVRAAFVDEPEPPSSSSE